MELIQRSYCIIRLEYVCKFVDIYHNALSASVPSIKSTYKQIINNKGNGKNTNNFVCLFV
jgi:hypothetical protein